MSDEQKPDAETSSEEGGKDEGKDAMNALLAEWKDGDKPKDLNPQLAEMIGGLSYKIDMPAVVKRVKGDLPLDDEYVEKFVNGAASQDKNLQKLWDERDSNKDAFHKALEGLHDQLAKPFEKKEDDLAAAVHSAREGESTDTGLDDVDFSQLSDSDFALKKAEVFRLAKAGQLK